MNELYIYARPLDSLVELTLDSGVYLSAHSTHANGRDDAHILVIPGGTHGQGARLTVTADGRQGSSVRGILCPSDNGSPATFVFDDFGELPLDDEESQPPAPTEPEPPDIEATEPEEIIHEVHANTDHDLSTHDGCGAFTEDCCVALHENDSDLWGHIRKPDPGQNQYNGHAVDALMLLAAEGAVKSLPSHRSRLPVLEEGARDAVALPPLGHPFAHGDDLTRAVRERDQRQRHRRAVTAIGDHQVPVVQRSCANPHQNLVGSGFRLGNFIQLQ